MNIPAGFWFHALLALFLGALGALAFTPWNGFWLAIAAWAGLYALLCREGSRPSVGRGQPSRQGGLGLIFGLGYFGVGVSWVYVSLHDNAGMSAFLSLLSTFLFCCVLALFHGVAVLGWSRLRGYLGLGTTAPSLPDALLFATVWALLEWSRGWVFTGFPWLSLGYSQLPANPVWSPLAGYFPLLGVYGVGLLTAFASALLLCGRRGWWWIGAIALSGMGLQHVSWTQPEGEAVPLALIQGNVPQSLKWDPIKFEETLQTYADLLQKVLQQPMRSGAKTRLVIFPETAFPSFLQEVPAAYRSRLGEELTDHGATLLTGVVTGDERQYFNSAVTLGGTEGGQMYHKVHLVPFGEFIPRGFEVFLRWANIPMSGFAEGQADQPPLQLAGVRMALSICYEDVFGEALRQSAAAARILVNLSNTAWFGDSLAQPQHLQIARVRAVELGRPVVRATNTGMTAVIRPDGFVESMLPAFEQGVLRAEVQGYAGETPYARWGNQAFLLVAGSFLLNLVTRRRVLGQGVGKGEVA